MKAAAIAFEGSTSSIATSHWVRTHDRSWGPGDPLKAGLEAARAWH
jgi:hypothetical protein